MTGPTAQEHLFLSIVTGRDLLARAYEVARFAHEGQTRWTSAGHVPYIVHPVRVFFRLVTWGVTDETLLAAAVLHDSVEDGPERVCEILGFDGDEPAEAIALHAIGRVFGRDVQDIVRGLTNEPDVPYLDHVAAATTDPRVLVVKAGDVWDNALSLSPVHPRYVKLSAKYAPLLPVLASRLHDSADAQSLLPAWRMVADALNRR